MSKHFDFIETPLKGLYVIHREPIVDARGFLSRFFCTEEFKTIGLTKPIVQINHSLTKKSGTVRGLHYQNPPNTEAKIVSCIRGNIFDVAVDIREGSPTFMKYYSEILSAENHTSLYIPEGFAHGFQTLTDDCELLYLHTNVYDSLSEGAININDPKLTINWPRPITELSDRDRTHPVMNGEFKGIQT